MLAKLWSADRSHIVCGLCPNSCRIAEGAAGICGVRRNEEGTLVALTYGRVTSIAVDPIEKKPVFHYRPGTSVLSVGSMGCSIRCRHCQNWRISREFSGPGEPQWQYLAPSALVDLAERFACPGVAFTYNEPIVGIEYVIDGARRCRRSGLFTIMVTNGYITAEGLDALGDLIDVWRVDLKGYSDETYESLCGVSGARHVMAAAERALHHRGMHVEVVTNLVPEIDDSVEELQLMANWIARGLGPDTPWHITRCFPQLDLVGTEPTSLDSMRMASAIGRDAGLHHVYLGNVTGVNEVNTFCPSCESVAITRFGYTINKRLTREGKCAICGGGLGIVE